MTASFLAVAGSGGTGMLFGHGPAALANHPPRPHGLSAITASFGQACNAASDDTRLHWPWGNDHKGGDYVRTHGRAWHVHASANFAIAWNRGAINRAVWGYACRKISGSNNWSVHSWGLAYDTNSVTNPLGQTWWNGVGSGGQNHGHWVPNQWQIKEINHFWGLNFSGRKDPMHFQYATGY